MSEREQAQALKLLAEWLKATASIVDSRQLEELRATTTKFLDLPIISPESHGQRRS